MLAAFTHRVEYLTRLHTEDRTFPTLRMLLGLGLLFLDDRFGLYGLRMKRVLPSQPGFDKFLGDLTRRQCNETFHIEDAYLTTFV